MTASRCSASAPAKATATATCRSTCSCRTRTASPSHARTPTSPWSFACVGPAANSKRSPTTSSSPPAAAPPWPPTSAWSSTTAEARATHSPRPARVPRLSSTASSTPTGAPASPRVSTQSEVLLPLTDDAFQLERALDGMFVNRGWTSLFDALRLGNETLATTRLPEGAYETLEEFCEADLPFGMVAFSNGVDNNSSDQMLDSGDGIDSHLGDVSSLAVQGVTTPIPHHRPRPRPRSGNAPVDRHADGRHPRGRLGRRARPRGLRAGEPPGSVPRSTSAPPRPTTPAAPP